MQFQLVLAQDSDVLFLLVLNLSGPDFNFN